MIPRSPSAPAQRRGKPRASGDDPLAQDAKTAAQGKPRASGDDPSIGSSRSLTIA